MLDFPSLVERELRASHDDESHVERDTFTFHPSQISRCRRQATISKLGLAEHDLQTLGYFEIGTVFHEWLEDRLSESFGGVHFERPVYHEVDAVTFTGRCDVYDEVQRTVYDFKTRSGWYKFDPPDEAHVDQLHVYMAAVGAEFGQVVYLSKKDLSVRTWPDGERFTFDPDRFERIVGKAHDIRQSLEELDELPTTVEAVPFEPCGCWLCEQE